MSKEIKRVGFIGLGIMGAPMAANCLKAGFELAVYNRTANKTEALAKAGAEVAVSPAALADVCDVVITCVTNTADVLEVVLAGEAPVIDGAHKGLVVIDCSTVSPQTAARCGEAFGGAGASFLDAPVSGGDVGAKAGTLSIMVGGRREDFDRVSEVLKAMGETITYCGPAGAGYTVKLCNQILGGLHLVAAAEAISLATAAGVDCQAMLQAVSAGAAGSWMLTNLAPKMIAGDDRPGFFVDYQLKDLILAREAAEMLGISLGGASLAEELFRAASAQGFGREGTQAIYHIVCEQANRE